MAQSVEFILHNKEMTLEEKKQKMGVAITVIGVPKSFCDEIVNKVDQLKISTATVGV